MDLLNLHYRGGKKEDRSIMNILETYQGTINELILDTEHADRLKHDFVKLQNLPVIDVRVLGVTGKNNADDTGKVQQAINFALSLPSGGVILFPYGKVRTRSLNLSNSGTGNRWVSPSIVLVGAGVKATRLEGIENGAILIDCMGRNFVTIKDMQLGTAPGIVYQTALLLARRTGGGGECHHNIIDHVYIRGEFSVAGAVAIAAEITRWNDVMIENDNATNNYCCFLTSPNNNLAGISSPNGTILPSTNTDNLMTGVVFWACHDNATPVILDESAEYTFIGCTVIPGGAYTGAKLVTYRASDVNGSFRGPVRWIGTLWEVGQGTVHHLQVLSTYGHFLDISDEKASYALGGDSYTINFSGGSAMIHGFRIEEPSPGVSTGGSRTMTINVDGVYNSYLDIYSPDFATTIIVNTIRVGSYFRAGTLTLPSSNDINGQVTWDEQAWQVPTLLNSWVNYGTPFNPAGYFKDNFGIVHLRGMVMNGTGMGNPIFVLPVGYRPAYYEQHASVSAGAIAYTQLGSDGSVTPVGGSTAAFCLDGITFRAA